MLFMSVKPAQSQEDNEDLICSTSPPAKKEEFSDVFVKEAQKATISRVAAMLARAKPEETK